jgi:hypothetical protein
MTAYCVLCKKKKKVGPKGHYYDPGRGPGTIAFVCGKHSLKAFCVRMIKCENVEVKKDNAKLSEALGEVSDALQKLQHNYQSELGKAKQKYERELVKKKLQEYLEKAAAEYEEEIDGIRYDCERSLEPKETFVAKVQNRIREWFG